MSVDNLKDYASELNPVQDRDYLQQAQGLVTQQFKLADIFNRYVELLVDNKAEILAVVDDLMQDRSLDTAVGAQLDILGRIVGQEREIVGFSITEYFGFDRALGSQSYGTLADESVGGFWRSLNNPEFENKELNDNEYRLIIKLKIVKNSSNGNIDSFLQAAEILYNTNTLVYNEGNGVITLDIGRPFNTGSVLVPELDESRLGTKYLPIPAGIRLEFQEY